MDVYEVLRLLQLQKSDRAIAAALAINRKTVGKYRAWAVGQGWLAQRALPSREELQPSVTYSVDHLGSERVDHPGRDLTQVPALVPGAVRAAGEGTGR